MSNDKQVSQGSQSRRELFTSAAALAAGSLACCGVAHGKSTTLAPVQQDEPQILSMSKTARDSLSPDQIIAKIKAGNKRFVTGTKIKRDFLSEMLATSEGQFPAAVLLSCIDSRAPAEVIFNLGIGDVFNCRIAGNIDNQDILGSMEFATRLAGAKVIFVLGHSACGAIKGAIADAKLGNLTQLLERMKPAIQATNYSKERSADNAEFVDAVARKNVELTMKNIRERSPVIAELEKANALKIAGGFYNIATGVVDFFE